MALFGYVNEFRVPGGSFSLAAWLGRRHPEPLIPIDEAAALMGRSVEAIRDLVKAGLVEAEMVDGEATMVRPIILRGGPR